MFMEHFLCTWISFCYSYFPNEETEAQRLGSLLKVTELVNGRTRI